MDIGTRLRFLRKKFGHTQEKVAELLGIDRVTYISYEKSRRIPDITVIQNLCQLYKCSADYLLGLSEKMDPYEPSNDLYEIIISGVELRFKGYQFSGQEKKVLLKNIENFIDMMKIMKK